MKRINYKSDFDFILTMQDCRGNDIGWPDTDWEARLYTTQKANAYKVGCKNGEPYNCYNDNGKIHVVCDNHCLSEGVINIEFVMYVNNEIYPDTTEKIVTPGELDIRLVREATPCPTYFEINMCLPLIKGDKGDPGEPGDCTCSGEGSLTDEQIEKFLSERTLTKSEIDELLSEIR